MSDNVIFLSGDIDEQNIGSVMQDLYSINKANLESGTNDPIYLYINSPGGLVYHAWGLIDFIQTISTPVYTVASGAVMSAGLSVFLAGDKRIALPNTSFLMHRCWSDLSGNIKEAEAHFNKMQSEDDRFFNFLSEKTGKMYAFWFQKLKDGHEVYFNVREAIEWGIVHEIGNSENLFL